jgi:hypothetical protein
MVSGFLPFEDGFSRGIGELLEHKILLSLVRFRVLRSYLKLVLIL